MITVTAAIICDREDKVLIAKRSQFASVPSKWEFPGGKVEENERAEDSLKRELLEELGIHVKVREYLTSSEYHYEHEQIKLLAYFCEIEKGEPQALVHEEIKWEKIPRLLQQDLAPADVPIAKILIKKGNDIVHTGPNL